MCRQMSSKRQGLVWEFFELIHLLKCQVSYQKIDNLHRAIVAEKENGQNNDLYAKYASILEFDKLAFKEVSEMFGILHSHFMTDRHRICPIDFY